MVNYSNDEVIPFLEFIKKERETVEKKQSPKRIIDEEKTNEIVVLLDFFE